jgi:hypothetical protein
MVTSILDFILDVSDYEYGRYWCRLYGISRIRCVPYSMSCHVMPCQAIPCHERNLTYFHFYDSILCHFRGYNVPVKAVEYSLESMPFDNNLV